MLFNGDHIRYYTQNVLIISHYVVVSEYTFPNRVFLIDNEIYLWSFNVQKSSERHYYTSYYYSLKLVLAIIT